MDEGWLVYHDSPSIPKFRPPGGSVDAHCHVFGPGAVFPYSSQRKYTPCDAPKEKLWALRDHLGISRNVIVQATCHGSDNRALVDALHDSGGRARGVAALHPDVSDEELQRLHAAGVRGVRYSYIRRLADAPPQDTILRIANRIGALGWHLVVYLEAQNLPDLCNFFRTLPTVVVFDHMARPDVTRDVNGPEFDLFIRLLKDNDNMWAKVSCPDRLSASGPPGYDDVIPFARRVVESVPDRVLWGTDWPHPNLKSHMPDDGELVDFIPRIAVTDQLRHKLLVANPMRLYWPEEVS